MNQQQKSTMLDRLQESAEVAFFEQLRTSAPLIELMPGLDELLVVSIPESIGAEIMRCRQAGCDNIDLQATLAVAWQAAVGNFRYFLRLRQAHQLPK